MHISAQAVQGKALPAGTGQGFRLGEALGEELREINKNGAKAFLECQKMNCDRLAV